MFTPAQPQMSQPQPSPDELDYLLRRAEDESIAAIRSVNAEVSARHDAMAFAYSSQAVAMLGALMRD